MCKQGEAPKSPGWCRDQMDIGIDLIRTAMNVMFESRHEDHTAAATTIEQGLKFLEPGRELLNQQNSAEVAAALMLRILRKPHPRLVGRPVVPAGLLAQAQGRCHRR